MAPFVIGLALWCVYKALVFLFGGYLDAPDLGAASMIRTGAAVAAALLLAVIAFGAVPRRWAPAVLAAQSLLVFGPNVFLGWHWGTTSAVAVA